MDCRTHKHFGGCLGQLRRLLLVLEHGIIVGGVSAHDAVAAGEAAALTDAAGVAGQGQQGDGLALLLLLVVEVQQRIEGQRQAGGAFRSGDGDTLDIMWQLVSVPNSP